MAASRLFDMVDNNQGRLGSIAQPDQSLTESGHGARIVFVLIVSRVERIDDDNIGHEWNGQSEGSDSGRLWN